VGSEGLYLRDGVSFTVKEPAFRGEIRLKKKKERRGVKIYNVTGICGLLT